MKKVLQKRLAAIAAGSGLVALAGSAHAAAPTTLSELATSVNFDAVGLAIFAIAAAIIPVYVIWKGSKFVLRAIKGA